MMARGAHSRRPGLHARGGGCVEYLTAALVGLAIGAALGLGAIYIVLRLIA
jgi:hypothetical protein